MKKRHVYRLAQGDLLVTLTIEERTKEILIEMHFSEASPQWNQAALRAWGLEAILPYENDRRPQRWKYFVDGRLVFANDCFDGRPGGTHNKMRSLHEFFSP